MQCKKIIILFFVSIYISGISFASETSNANSQVEQLINSPQGQALYNLEIQISQQKKQNELLKLKEEAIKLQKEIRNASAPSQPTLPTTAPSYQFPTKGYFAPSPGFQEPFTSILKKKKTFQVMMVEKDINALVKQNGSFYFVKIGDRLNRARVIRISGYGITLDKNGTRTFYPLSIIIPDNNKQLPILQNGANRSNTIK
jgi:hypothetical protein